MDRAQRETRASRRPVLIIRHGAPYAVNKTQGAIFPRVRRAAISICAFRLKGITRWCSQTVWRQKDQGSGVGPSLIAALCSAVLPRSSQLLSAAAQGVASDPWPTGHLIRSAKLIQDDVDAEEEAEEHMEEVPRLNWPRGAYSW